MMTSPMRRSMPRASRDDGGGHGGWGKSKRTRPGEVEPSGSEPSPSGSNDGETPHMNQNQRVHVLNDQYIVKPPARATGKRGSRGTGTANTATTPVRLPPPVHRPTPVRHPSPPPTCPRGRPWTTSTNQTAGCACCLIRRRRGGWAPREIRRVRALARRARRARQTGGRRRADGLDAVEAEEERRHAFKRARVWRCARGTCSSCPRRCCTARVPTGAKVPAGVDAGEFSLATLGGAGTARFSWG